jgi:hypothetical protein
MLATRTVRFAAAVYETVRVFVFVCVCLLVLGSRSSPEARDRHTYHAPNYALHVRSYHQALRLRGGCAEAPVPFPEAQDLPRDPKAWTVQHVLCYMERLRPKFKDRMDHYRTLFTENDIDGSILLALTPEKLEKASALTPPSPFRARLLFRVVCSLHAGFLTHLPYTPVSQDKYAHNQLHGQVGITSLGHREHLMTAINELKVKQLLLLLAA